MGDFQALVHRAPGHLETLSGGIETWMHCHRVEAVRVRLAEMFGHDALDLRPPGGGGPDGAPAELHASAYVVVDLPLRWRIVERGHIEVRDGDRSWSGTGTLVTEARGEPSALSEAGVLGICLYPGRLVGGLRFGEPVAAVVEGRPCWVVDARPRPLNEASSAAALALSVGRRLTEFVGVEHRFWFDADTGIVLRHEGSIDGETCSTI
ncbi:MAG TPA: hypothetical protein VF743_13825, partial [Acidimicrobiales bacterium]